MSGAFCVLCVLEVGRASLTAAVPSPRGILTQKFGSLYWMEKGSVCPRREPATDEKDLRHKRLVWCARHTKLFAVVNEDCGVNLVA